MSKNNKDFFKLKNNWSEIKDSLLSCYLKPYFQKILKTRKSIYYVDCFAGKGKFDDGNPGSPIVALEICADCARQSVVSDSSNKIETCFIELNHAEELEANIKSSYPTHRNYTVISGEYEENIQKILSKKHGYNIFLYIDPYGIKALDFDIFNKLESFELNSIEMLINFNSFGFIRGALSAVGVSYTDDIAFKDLDELVEYEPTIITRSENSVAVLNSIAGGAYWQDIIESFHRKEIDGYEAEKIFSQAYKNKLKNLFKYVLDMPIRLKAGQHPKYRMIHASNHEDGCLLMAQNMLKRKDELFLNIQQNKQLSLLDFIEGISSTVDNKIITREEIEHTIKKHISNQSVEEIDLKKFLADFFNEHGLLCEFKMLYEILESFQNTGFIDIERTPAVTKNNRPTTFWEPKKGQSIVIRRKQS